MTILLSFLMSMPCMSLHVTTQLHALFQLFTSPLFDAISYCRHAWAATAYLPVIRVSMRYNSGSITFFSFRFPLGKPSCHLSTAGLAADVYSCDHFDPIEGHGEACEFVKG
jgi:hypothetical protein